MSESDTTETLIDAVRRLTESRERDLVERRVGLGARPDVALGGAKEAGGPPKNQDAGAAGDRHHQSIAEGSNAPPPNAALLHERRRALEATVETPPGVVFAANDARIADFIDHTLLKAEASALEIDTLCDEAREHRFAAVCVNPAWVVRCARRLHGAPIQVATVIGFPLGANTSESKRAEARNAIENGATELDMVIALGHVKSRDWSHVAADIAGVVDAAAGALVKVIIESASLTPFEIIKACEVARDARAQYVKTSTGFHASGGASSDAVALMRLVVGDAMGVKASGGVRDCATALRMIASGATRIGTSSGVSMAQCRGTGPLPLHELLSRSVAGGAGVAAAAPSGERAGSGSAGTY